MKQQIWHKCLCFIILVLYLGSMHLTSFADAQKAESALSDEFDLLRERWVERLTGGNYLQTGEGYTKYIKPKIDSITSEALNWQKSMTDKSAMDAQGYKGYLWSDLQMGDTRDEYHRYASRTSSTFGRIQTMALAYKTKGSALEGNEQLLQDIISAMNYMYTYKYNENTPRTNRNLSPSNPSENWYYWEISMPRSIENILALIYDGIDQTLIDQFQRGIDKQVPGIGAAATGANRLDNCSAAIVGGIVQKNPDRVRMGTSALSTELVYSTDDDGFYQDGSFIQHHDYSYNGAYGVTALGSLAEIILLVQNSTLKITDPNLNNFYCWIYDSFDTLNYEGKMMDATRGRSISRSNDQGYGLLEPLVVIAQFAPEPHRSFCTSLIKRWCENNSLIDPYARMSSVYTISKLYEILNDTSVNWRADQNLYQNFGAMDRAVAYRDGFAFNISMYSDRNRNYETTNGENLKSWHTAAGMTYLYNDDLKQFDDQYWPTVDKHRLPGTTVVKGSESVSGVYGQAFTGGVDLDGHYGTNAMQYQAPKDTNDTTHDLKAKKSWFLFDDEIVALGSDITSTKAGDSVETIIENRKTDGANVLTVDGTQQPLQYGQSKTLNDVNWAHLKGNSALTAKQHSTDIGYYFPETTNINALRKTESGSWKELGTSGGSSTRNYLSLAIDHGTKPTGQTYAYALLPGKTTDEIKNYSETPDFQILQNDARLQAVKEKKLGITSAVVWQGGQTVGAVTCKNPSMLMMREDETSLELAFSDPTQSQEKIEFELDQKFAGIASMDNGVAVSENGNRTSILVNPQNSNGKTFRIHLSKTKLTGTPAAPDGLTAEMQTPTSAQISWSPVEDAANYHLFSSTTESGPYLPVANFESIKTDYTQRRMAIGTSYYYRVAAENASGISDYSETISVKTPTPPSFPPQPSISETFENYLTGPLDFQNGWEVTLGPDKASYVDVVENGNSNKQLSFYSQAGAKDNATAKAVKKFSPLSNVISVDGDFTIQESDWKNLMVLYGDAGRMAIQLYANQGQLWTYNGSSYTTKHPFQDFEMSNGQTYHIKVQADVKQNTFSVSVDGRELDYAPGEALTFRNTVTYLDTLECSLSKTKGSMTLDNLSLKEVPITQGAIQVFDIKGNPVQGLPTVAGDYTVRATYTNRSDSALPTVCLMTLSDGAKMVSSGREEKILAAGETYTYQTSIAIPQNRSRKLSLKAMLWNDLNSVMPYTDVMELH